jgi:hypothetical protein
MASQTFSAKGNPKTVANNAAKIIRRAQLQECSVTRRGDGYVTLARWEEDCLFLGSTVEIRVNATGPYSGKGSEVEITDCATPCPTLTERLPGGL